MTDKTYNCPVCREDFDFPPNAEVCRLGAEFSERVISGEFEGDMDALIGATDRFEEKARQAAADHYDSLSPADKEAFDRAGKSIRPPAITG